MSGASGQSDNSRRTPPAHQPGRGIFGWLGRQVGYVTRAVQHEPTAIIKEPTPIFRSAKVEEQVMPTMPHVKLRRTTIDEVVIDREMDIRSKASDNVRK